MVGSWPIVSAQYQGVQACPTIGHVPMCYVVLAGYSLVALSGVLGERTRNLSFTLGMVPLLMLAVVGSSLEWLGQDTCPKTEQGIPTCVISLLVTVVLTSIFLLERRLRTPIASMTGQ